VTDRHGKPITNLTAKDFEIFEEGVPQPVSNFYVVQNAAPRVDQRPDAVAPPEPERFRRKVLVLVDNVNSSMRGRNLALERLEKFIAEHFDDGRYDWSVATVDRRVHLLLPMTSDKKRLHTVVANIRRAPSRHEMQAPIARGEGILSETAATNAGGSEDERGINSITRSGEMLEQNKNFDDERRLSEQTMFAQSSVEGIAEAARAFGTVDGRKIILLVTGYLPLGAVSPISRVGGVMNGSHTDDVVTKNNTLSILRDRLIHEANASNTSFYIISADGLEVPEQSPVTRATFDHHPSPTSNAADTSAMFWLAKETGGAYLPGNRIDDSFAEVDRRSANYYALGYVAHHPDDGRYRSLAVRVKGHSEYRLQYRDGYSSAPTDTQLQRTLRTTLGVTMQPSTLAMTLLVDPPQYRGTIALVPIKAAMTMESLQYITDATGSRTRLHVYVSIFDADGRNITLAKSFADVNVKANETATGPMTVSIPSIALKKGSYRVVVAVRDELTDHVGLAVKKIDV
jgi:VWFA-related protein